MRVIFTKLARQELEDAVRFYELEYSGLGRRLKEEVRKAALRIAAYPEGWSIERGDVRKCHLHKFEVPSSRSLANPLFTRGRDRHASHVDIGV